MLGEFEQVLRKHCRVAPEQKILAAVSGGRDSMLLAHLLHEVGQLHGVAHLNFGLRKDASDKDEAFVKAFAEERGIPFYVKRVDTQKLANAQKVSIQMAARSIRYSWFNELLAAENFDGVAVGTHLTDQLETMLLNQIKGTGISGLHGIAPHRDRIIRPLMGFSRAQVDVLVQQYAVAFREDESNAAEKYQRNFVRHKILPELKKLNPNVVHTFNENANRIQEAEQIYRSHIDLVRAQLFTEIQDGHAVHIAALRQLHPQNTWLFELFRPFGLAGHQVAELQKLLLAATGAKFVSATHAIFVNREQLHIQRLKNDSIETIVLDRPQFFKENNIQINVEDLQAEEIEVKNSSPNVAWLDADYIQWPLEYRKWQPGDRFVPYGMDGSKKVSDFLKDEKVPPGKKPFVRVLVSGQNIIWVAGFRIHNDFGITASTQRVLKISI